MHEVIVRLLPCADRPIAFSPDNAIFFFSHLLFLIPDDPAVIIIVITPYHYYYILARPRRLARSREFSSESGKCSCSNKLFGTLGIRPIEQNQKHLSQFTSQDVGENKAGPVPVPVPEP